MSSIVINVQLELITAMWPIIIIIISILVVIIDPGIKTEKGYSAYDDGLKMDVFVKVYVSNNNRSLGQLIKYY